MRPCRPHPQGSSSCGLAMCRRVSCVYRSAILKRHGFHSLAEAHEVDETLRMARGMWPAYTQTVMRSAASHPANRTSRRQGSQATRHPLACTNSGCHPLYAATTCRRRARAAERRRPDGAP